ncbi:MAG: hypothetical protein ACM3SQ_05960 [Betaproteobacteria bacterium]
MSAERPSESGTAGRNVFAGWRLGAALGLRAAVAPAMVYVPIGYLLGSNGSALLSPSALRHLDLVVWLALATVGVFVGLGLELRTPIDRMLLLVASTEAVVTAAVVAGATAWLAGRWALPIGNPVASVPLVAGLSAAASAVVIAGRSGDPGMQRAARISDLDDVTVIVLGAWALSWHPGVAIVDAIRAAAVTIPLGAAIAAAGLLLFDRARGEAERGTFVLGVLALLAGAAAYLSLSPLMVGMVAGLLWRWAPGRADEIIRADLVKLHHPLVILLLVIAGATSTLSALSIWLLAPFVVFRLAGKLAGAWAGARMFPGTAPADLGARLLPCGLIGIALALHFNQLLDGPIGSALVSAVAIGAIVFEAMTVLALAGDRG